MGKAGYDQKVSDAELIGLLCKTEAEIDVHGESEFNLLLHDFASELLKQRLLVYARRPTAPESLELSRRIEDK
jgi:hypothetical protein